MLGGRNHFAPDPQRTRDESEPSLLCLDDAFWICYLSLLALVVIYAPQGGLRWPGLHYLPTPV
jgi:hypothetical protein